MNMQKKGFMLGIGGGLILALVIVFAASYSSTGLIGGLTASPRYGAASYVEQVVSSTVTTTETLPVGPSLALSSNSTMTEAATATSSATAAAPGNLSTPTATGTLSIKQVVTTTVVTSTVESELSPYQAANVAASGATYGSGAAYFTGPTAQPSSVNRLLTQPAQSAILFLPILLAVLLGLAFFRASRTRE